MDCTKFTNHLIMKAGRTLGLFFLIIGVAGAFIGYSSYAYGGTLKMLLFFPIIALAGLAMTIFPGSNYTNKDLREKKIEGNDIFLKASTTAKAIWLSASIIGFILSTTFREELTNLFK